MKIALNVLSAKAGGGLSTFVNLIPALNKADRSNEYVIFVSSTQTELLTTIPGTFKKVIIDYTGSNPLVRMVWEQLVFPIYLLFLKVDLLYSVGNVTSLLAPCRIVLLIENSNPYSRLNIKWTKKEALRNKLLRIIGWLSAKRADKIRFVSHNSKGILAAQLRLPEEKCSVIYHGFGKSPELDQGCKYPFNYLLTVAVVAPHKNLDNLIKAFKILITKYEYEGNLVIAGDLCYPGYEGTLRALIRDLELSERILFSGRIPHMEIGCFYKYADLFILPSIEETFGLPVIEAMGYGVPVAVSDSKACLEKHFLPFREICGDACHYFDPFDPADIADGINQVLCNQRYRQQLKTKGLSRVKQYSWDRTVDSLIKIFSEVGKS